jgi:hypothetical protein
MDRMLFSSRGPMVYWSPTDRDYEILGVIKRKERDAERVSINGVPAKEGVKSGVVEGYSIDMVVEAINQSSLMRDTRCNQAVTVETPARVKE